MTDDEIRAKFHAQSNHAHALEARQFADVIDLNAPATAALMTAGLGLLVSKNLLTLQESQRIGAGTPPA